MLHTSYFYLNSAVHLSDVLTDYRLTGNRDGVSHTLPKSILISHLDGCEDCRQTRQHPKVPALEEERLGKEPPKTLENSAGASRAVQSLSLIHWKSRNAVTVVSRSVLS